MHKPYRLTLRAILQNEKGEVLFLQRAANCINQPGYWELPGGKMDPGENVSEALIREVREETALKIELQHLHSAPEWEDAKSRIAYLIFMAEILSGDFAISHEHDDFCWFSPKKALADLQVSPQLEESVRKLIK